MTRPNCMRYLLITPLLALTLLLAGCGGDEPDAPCSKPGGAGCYPQLVEGGWEITIDTTGGHCAGPCGSKTVVDDRGRVTRFRNGSDSGETVRLSDRDTESLNRLVGGTSKQALRVENFTGTCPIAYDGTKETIWFNYDDDDHDFTLDSCKDVFDDDARLLVRLHELHAED